MLGKFRAANSLWYSLAALSYAWAASISFLKYPSVLVIPSAVIFATHRFSLEYHVTPLYFEEPVLWVLLVWRLLDRKSVV